MTSKPGSHSKVPASGKSVEKSLLPQKQASSSSKDVPAGRQQQIAPASQTLESQAGIAFSRKLPSGIRVHRQSQFDSFAFIPSGAVGAPGISSAENRNTRYRADEGERPGADRTTRAAGRSRHRSTCARVRRFRRTARTAAARLESGKTRPGRVRRRP